MTSELVRKEQLMETGYERTGSTQEFDNPGAYFGVKVITDGTNDVTCIGYDVSQAGDIAPGNKIFEFFVAGGDRYGGEQLNPGLYLQAGLYIQITGTGGSFIARYRED